MSCICRLLVQRCKSLVNIEHSFRTRCSYTFTLLSTTSQTQVLQVTFSDSVMQKGKVPKVTCLLVNCSPVEVVLWEELFVLTKGEIETCHDTRVYAKQQKEEDEEKYERVGES